MIQDKPSTIIKHRGGAKKDKIVTAKYLLKLLKRKI